MRGVREGLRAVFAWEDRGNVSLSSGLRPPKFEVCSRSAKPWVDISPMY